MRLPAIAAGQPQVFSSKRGCDEADENGVRVFRSTLEFRMELYTYEKGVSWNLDDFRKTAFWIDSAHCHSCLFQISLVCCIEFIAVTMAFRNL